MFTGIITDIGTVRRVVPGADTRLEIETALDLADMAIGASIACSGPCLTVIDKGGGDAAAHDWFAVEVSAETLARTTLREWKPGTRVNLERPLRIGDELGGHMVSGHIDGIATVRERSPATEGAGSIRLVVEAPPALVPLISEKGSVALDGVSLTVNSVDGAAFAVNVIPHTFQRTTLGDAEKGGSLNIEVDLIARYVARLVPR